MKISIIIPVYNSSSYLARCLDSIINQTYNNIEIIIINDGSVDNSEKICTEYLLKDKRIKYFYQSNKGVSAARNLGIINSTGELISFVDSDDYIDHDTYQNVVKIFKGNEECDLVNIGYVIEEINNKKSVIRGENTIVPAEEAIRFLFNKKYFKGFACNKVFKSSIIRNFKLEFDMNITICEDLKFCFNYLEKSNKCVCVESYYYHYIINSNSTTKRYVDAKQISFIEVYKEIIEKSKVNKIALKEIYSAYIEALVYISKQALIVGCSDLNIAKLLRREIRFLFPRFLFWNSTPLKSRIGGVVFCIIPFKYNVK